MKFRKIDPGDIDRRHIYRLMVGTIVPRPIAWVSTISAAESVIGQCSVRRLRM